MSRSQNNLFSIIIILVAVVGGYLYYTQFASEPVIVESDLIQRDDLDEFENINLDFSILDEEVFRSLQQIGESPIDPGAVGKRDLFVPIR